MLLIKKNPYNPQKSFNGCMRSYFGVILWWGIWHSILSVFQNVKEGMLLLGCVKEVTDFEVTVSLPCGLQGFLSIKNVCDSYTKLLTAQLDSADTEVGLQSVN